MSHTRSQTSDLKMKNKKQNLCIEIMISPFGCDINSIVLTIHSPNQTSMCLGLSFSFATYTYGGVWRMPYAVCRMGALMLKLKCHCCARCSFVVCMLPSFALVLSLSLSFQRDSVVSDAKTTSKISKHACIHSQSALSMSVAATLPIGQSFTFQRPTGFYLLIVYIRFGSCRWIRRSNIDPMV